MKFTLNITLFLIFIVSFGCAPAAKVTTTKISLGATAVGTNDYPGGLMIMAYSKDLDIYNMQPVTNSEITIELPAGGWEFAAIGWTGLKPLEGNTKCAHQAAKLDGGDVEITLPMSEANCSNSLFGSKFRKTNNQIKSLKISNCSINKNGIEKFNDITGDEDCLSNPGKYKSYKVYVHGYIGVKQSEQFTKRGKYIASECLPVVSNSTSNNPAIYQVKLPIPETSPFSIQAFNSADCSNSTESKSVHFVNGMNDGIPRPNYEGFVKNGSTTTTIFLKSDICSDNYPIGPVSNFSVTGAPYYICNETQFGSINTNPATLSADYILANDIDFNNDANNKISGTFKGTLDGKGYSLLNFKETVNSGNSGLFLNVQGSVEIKDLVIDSFESSVNSGATTQEHGLLISSLTTNSATRIELKNIKIINSWLKTVKDRNGLLVGQVNNNASGSLEITGIEIENSQLNPQFDGVEKLGLIAGYILNSNTIEDALLTNIKVSNSKILYELGSDNGRYIGAAVGQADNLTLSNITLKKVELEGTTGIGGIIGKVEKNILIDDVLIDGLLITPSSNVGVNTSISGIAGETLLASIGDEVIIKNSNIKDFTIKPRFSSGVLKNVGGLIGNIGNTNASTEITLQNNKVKYFVLANGSNFGGIIGNTNNCTSVAARIKVVGNIAYSGFSTDTADTDNHSRAGVAGCLQSANLSSLITQNLIFTKILGANKLAGIAAETNLNILKNHIEIDIDQSNVASGSMHLAGMVATTSSIVVQNLLDNKIKGSINSGLTLQCNNSSIDSFGVLDMCGLILGENLNTSIVINRNILLVDFDTNGDSNIPVEVAVFGGALLTNIQTDDISDHSFGTEWRHDSSATVPYELVFMSKLRKMNSVISNNTVDIDNDLTMDFDDYTIGNKREPILIINEQGWNEVADNDFLLEKSYELGNNLDFLQTTANFIPFGGKGSSVAHFNGNFFNNGNYTIRGVRMDSAEYTGTAALGIFRYLNTSSRAPTIIGTPEHPIIVDDLEINMNSNNMSSIGSIAGMALQTEISARVYKSNINGNGAGDANLGVGGIIGSIGSSNKHFVLENSLFHGSINDTGLDSFDRVGGLIGAVPNMPNSETFIKYNAAKLSNLEGATHVGGLIATFDPSTTNTKSALVSNSVSFEAGSIINSNSGIFYGLIGAYLPAATQSFHTNFVDIVGLATPPLANNYITNAGAASGGDGVKNFVITGPTHTKTGNNSSHVENTALYDNHKAMASDAISTNPIFTSTDHDFIFDGNTVKHSWE